MKTTAPETKRNATKVLNILVRDAQGAPVRLPKLATFAGLSMGDLIDALDFLGRKVIRLRGSNASAAAA